MFKRMPTRDCEYIILRKMSAIVILAIVTMAIGYIWYAKNNIPIYKPEPYTPVVCIECHDRGCEK